jgi:hypothetical protein
MPATPRVNDSNELWTGRCSHKVCGYKNTFKTALFYLRKRGEQVMLQIVIHTSPNFILYNIFLLKTYKKIINTNGLH